MITLYRRGRVYWAQSNFAGVRRQWSLKTRDRRVADELLRQAQIDQLSGTSHRPKVWAEFQKDFLAWIEHNVEPSTYKEYSRVLKTFSSFLDRAGVSHVGDVNTETLTAFTTERSKSTHRINGRKMSPGGLKFEQRVLRRVFSYAIDMGFMSRNPIRVKNLNSTAGKTLPFTREEVSVQLNCEYIKSRPTLKAVVLLFVYSGLRISDVINLQRFAIAGDVLHHKTQKRKTIVRFPLHPEVVAALKLHFADQKGKQKSSPYVFATEEGRPIVSLDKHLRRLWKACGVENGHAHRFRDTFAVNILEQGGSLYDVAKLLGIGHQTAERHYTPWVKELQQRAATLVGKMEYSVPESATA